MLMSVQVDLSMLFPEPSVVEGLAAMTTPVFLSGEKRQAVYTTTSIRPEKKTEKFNKEVNRVLLNDYLSKYYIELSQDLDDAVVLLLVENGLRERFPAICDAWKSQLYESKATARKCVLEKKKCLDEEIKNDKSLLEDTLAKEVTRKILKAYPLLDQKEFFTTGGVGVESGTSGRSFHSCFFKSKSWL